jgi:hypothetical protein
MPGMENAHDEHGFSAEGAVVEILERGGERFAKILIRPGTVLELPAGSIDVSLGDTVAVDALLNVKRLKPGEAAASGSMPPGASRGPDQPLRRSDYQHVWRMAAVFVVAVLLFLVWRAWMVPADFGTYGHFRAGAIVEAAARTPRFAGQASCVDCHSEVQQLRVAGSHKGVACEACHGPLGEHARGESSSAPIRPSSRGVCLTCHTSRIGMPAAFPKVIVNEHSESGPCTDCHASHSPGIS